MNDFIYGELLAARQDLLSFSQMNIHEDRPLYLVVSDCSQGYQIKQSPGKGSINAIAINGQMFMPLR